MPTLSIITITYNNAVGLEKTAASILSQACIDYEWIIIDGGSTDQTHKLLKTYTSARITSGLDRGIYHAMNKGIDQATGKYFIFMNAGDCFAETNLVEKCILFLKQNTPDFLYSDAIEHQPQTDERIFKPARSHDKPQRGMFTHHQAMIYKSSILKQNNIIYNEAYNIAADYDLTLRTLKHCAADKIIYLPDAPICIFERGGLSNQQAKLGRTQQFTIRHHQKTCSALENYLINARQIITGALSNHAPTLYKHLRGIKKWRAQTSAPFKKS